MHLALDTSTLTLSLALLDGDAVVEHVIEGPPKKQSELLPQVIEALVQRHSVQLSSLEAFIVGLGPGSFTGLRIGLSTFKGLAYAVQKPLVGVSSLAALALETPVGAEVISLAVVKKGELYVGHFAHEGNTVRALEAEHSLPLASVAAFINAHPRAIVVGPALVDYRAALTSLGVDDTRLLNAPLFPSAIALARLAPRPWSFDATTLFGMEPHYIRGSGAEENPQFPPLPGVEPRAKLKED